MQLGDLNTARKFFQRATKINKKFAAAYNNIGAIYFAQKQYSKAIRQYQKALSIAGADRRFLQQHGLRLFRRETLSRRLQGVSEGHGD